MMRIPGRFSAGWLVVALVFCGCAPPRTLLNDVHSRLNPTEVAEYHEPTSAAEIVDLVVRARRSGRSVSISGGRHAMGGQQFGAGTIHLNLSRYDRVVRFDPDRGLVTVESGIEWPELIDWLVERQRGSDEPFGIRQKQTGADRLSIGGALSANVHGRGLTLAPIVSDVESFELVDAGGEILRCSREENPELFRLAIGGYGLFGVITEVTLRLAPRLKLERKVEIVAADDVPGLVEQRIRDGYLYGDYQFKTDESADDFLGTGVFSFYRPVAASTATVSSPRDLGIDGWNELYKLAHLDKSRAFRVYSDYYLSTDGQVYWSDTHQLSTYVSGLDRYIDETLGARAPGSLMIGEVYVPRDRLPSFLEQAAAAIRETKANLVYGTVRFIERDEESFLAWAKGSYACIVMNLRVTHDTAGLEEAEEQFRALIDVALSMNGSYFLTYHRWARKDQLLAAYPQFPEFLRLKLRYDPEERFQSEWYRYYRRMLADELVTGSGRAVTISEPATVITDYAMAVVALAFAVVLARRRRPGSHVAWWAFAFALVAAGSLVGGTYHGFHWAMPFPFAVILWQSTLVLALFSSFAVLRAVDLQWSREERRSFWAAIAGAKLAVAVVVSLVWPDFAVVVVDGAMTLVLAVVLGASRRSSDPRAFRFLVTGVAIFGVGALVQQVRLAPSTAFNHNDLFHVMQIAANASFFLSARPR